MLKSKFCFHRPKNIWRQGCIIKLQYYVENRLFPWFCWCQIYFLPQQEKSILFSSLQLFFLNMNNNNFVYSRNKHWRLAVYKKQRRQSCLPPKNAPASARLRNSCTRPQWDPVWWQFPRRRTAWHARGRRRCCSCWERRRQGVRVVAAHNRARPGQKVPTRASAEIEREKELLEMNFTDILETEWRRRWWKEDVPVQSR